LTEFKAISNRASPKWRRLPRRYGSTPIFLGALWEPESVAIVSGLSGAVRFANFKKRLRCHKVIFDSGIFAWRGKILVISLTVFKDQGWDSPSGEGLAIARGYGNAAS
jgi:hypothetical protein